MHDDYDLRSTGEILTALLLSLGKFPPPTAYMYILMCIIVKRRMNYNASIYSRHRASIPKILMARNLFCSIPCGVLVTVVL